MYSIIARCNQRCCQHSLLTTLSRPVAKLNFFFGGGGAEPQKVDLLDLTPHHKTPFLAHFMTKSRPLWPNPPHKTPFLAHFVAKSGPFDRFGGCVWLQAWHCRNNGFSVLLTRATWLSIKEGTKSVWYELNITIIYQELHLSPFFNRSSLSDYYTGVVICVLSVFHIMQPKSWKRYCIASSHNIFVSVDAILQPWHSGWRTKKSCFILLYYVGLLHDLFINHQFQLGETDQKLGAQNKGWINWTWIFVRHLECHGYKLSNFHGTYDWFIFAI